MFLGKSMLIYGSEMGQATLRCLSSCSSFSFVEVYSLDLPGLPLDPVCGGKWGKQGTNQLE